MEVRWPRAWFPGGLSEHHQPPGCQESQDQGAVTAGSVLGHGPSLGRLLGRSLDWRGASREAARGWSQRGNSRFQIEGGCNRPGKLDVVFLANVSNIYCLRMEPTPLSETLGCVLLRVCGSLRGTWKEACLEHPCRCQNSER